MAFNKTPEITTHYIADLEYESVNQTGNKVKVDMHGGAEKKHQSPTELLLTALASCSAVDVAEILKKRKKSFTEFYVKATGDRREEHPRAFTKINLHFTVTSPNIQESELLKNAKIVVEKYCSVATTVSGVAKLSVTVEVKDH